MQIYSQFVEVSDALQQEKDENIRLKQYLDQILKVKLTAQLLPGILILYIVEKHLMLLLTLFMCLGNAMNVNFNQVNTFMYM